MNPYNFVPLGPPAERKPVHFHHKFHGLTGTLTCRIQTLTHFFTAAEQERGRSRGHQELRLLRENGAPVIPGSSLKGAIRIVAEAISGSCLVLPSSRSRSRRDDQLEYFDFRKKRKDRYYLPDGFYPCGLNEKANIRNQKACPACRIFGYLNKGVLFGGNVSFESAHIVGNYRTETLTLEPFGSPAPRHRPFYGTPDSEFKEIRGRKFYYHRVEGARTTREKNDFNKTVEAVVPGAVFEFSVNYENLSEEELALLIFALALEDPMRHKIGMGKGVGLGSVHITITRWEQRDVQNRYRQYGGGITVLTEEDLQKAIEEQIRAYHHHYARWRDSLVALRDILTWDEEHPRDPAYPSNAWFKDNPSVPLEDVPDDAAEYGPKVAPRGSVTPDRSASRPHSRQQQDAKENVDAKKLLKQFQRKQERTSSKGQTAYRNGDTESKATAHLAADGNWQVSLPKLPGERFPLKTKPYSNAKEGKRIRVRVVVNQNGNVVRGEEL
ncbi:MAG: hypothetical protein D6732_12375 [Methanobacteriota archaeon]|nr:MAG: hypothetical protein D6732_12375 [Euryarchaeota archaeon]